MIRAAALVVAALVVPLGAAACATSAPAPQQPTATTSSATPGVNVRIVVALGDSVPRGVNCDCTPYPPLTAADLSTADVRVDTFNDSVSGYTTTQVVHQLADDQSVIADTADADAVEIEVGANDVGYSSSCGTSVSCYTRRLPEIETNLTDIVRRVHDLGAARHPRVILLDYWSVWLGGSYATEQGPAYVTAAEQVTNDVNGAIKSVATASGSAYVDLRAAFKGPDYTYDETHYLSDDGDHPNAAGHQQIARATAQVLEATRQGT